MNDIPYGYVYEITNKINGKTYVGCRKLSLDRYWRQYMGSGIAIISSINKYGKDNFVKSLLGYAYSIDSLFEMEMIYINDRKSRGQGAEYNISSSIRSGGDTFSLIDEDRLLDIKRRQSESILKAYSEGRIRRSSKWVREDREWEEFKASSGNEIVDIYLETGSIEAVSKKTGFSRSKIREYITESGIELNHMNRFQSKRFPVTEEKLESFYESQRLPEEEKKKYIPKPRTLICAYCGEEFKSTSHSAKYCQRKCRRENKRKFNPEHEKLYREYVTEGKNINDLMEIYKCSQRTVYNMLERNDIPRKRSNKNKK